MSEIVDHDCDLDTRVLTSAGHVHCTVVRRLPPSERMKMGDQRQKEAKIQFSGNGQKTLAPVLARSRCENTVTCARQTQNTR